jgi:hypothetical protein
MSCFRRGIISEKPTSGFSFQQYKEMVPARRKSHFFKNIITKKEEEEEAFMFWHIEECLINSNGLNICCCPLTLYYIFC